MSPKTAPGAASKKAKWTVMVFMGADTIKGNAPLIKAAEADLREMRSVGSGERLNIFVQVHGKGPVPRRGRITKGVPKGIDALDIVPDHEQETEGGRAIECFIGWSLEESERHLPKYSRHYSMLVLWGHAYDFAIDRAKTAQGTIDPLEFAELTRVLERLQARFRAAGDMKLDILGFDACDLSTVEMACQFQPFAKYLLGSQIGIPIPGWPYDRILDRLLSPIGTLMCPAEFGSYIVRRFCESYVAAARTVSLTLLDLDRTDELVENAKLLALMLARGIDDPVARDRLASLFSQSQTAPRKPYVDLADMCLNLVRRSGDPRVVEAARNLGDFLISPQSEVVGKSARGGGRPFVVEHGRNAGETARLNGVSIYAPHVAPNYDFDAVRHPYENFTFAKKTLWSDLVHVLTRPS
jgi:hypothetical protein